MSNTFRLIIVLLFLPMKMRCDRVFSDYFTRGGDGVCSEDILADLSASSETHLQLLPSKLNIVGKELCEV